MKNLIFALILFSCDAPNIVPSNNCWDCQIKMLKGYGSKGKQSFSFDKWGEKYCDKSETEIKTIQDLYYINIENQYREMICTKMK